MGNSSSSSTSNVWGKQNPSMSCCGGGGCRSITGTPTCYCGEKYVLRTVKTTQREKISGVPNFKVMLFC